MTARLALGTVQFGAVYGINNKTGRIPERETAAILRRASLAGVDILDTSQAYGESETVLGGILPSLRVPLRVVSKFIAGPGLSPGVLLSGSLARLKQKALYAFLYHRFSDFADYPGWYEELLHLRDGGATGKIGFSVYYPRELQSLLDGGIKFGLVQVPYSVFDRRFEPLFPVLKKAGIEVHVRSVFLQGLAFMDPAALPAGLSGIRPKLERLRSLAGKTGVPVSALCLCFALRNPGVDRVVIGVDGLTDLENNLAGSGRQAEIERAYPELLTLAEKDEELLLPFKWKK
jgi:aryl-alcohol dehydrogenase-like predicted oxidoreductase